VKCELDNRKDPSGECTEGMIGDVAVSISLLSASELSSDKEYYQHTFPGCKTEIDTAERVLISCEDTANLQDHMRYIMYLQGSKSLKIGLEVFADSAKENGALIKGILDSFAAL
jgi:hypothetical protein